MYLSEHFTLQEATVSQEADRRDIDNSSPPTYIVDVMRKTATKLEKVRTILGKPIHINSWYRCPELNAALGSNSRSQHPKGEAVDFISPQFGSPLNICKIILANQMLIRFDQLILEHSWVHISWKTDPNAIQRGEVLSLLKSGGYAAGLTDKLGNKL